MTKPVFKNRPNECVTTVDGRKIWNGRNVAVVMLLVMVVKNEINKYDEFVLIEKRGNAPGLDKQGLWCLPCGYLDWDESGPDAMKRELWEEVGINLEDPTFEWRRSLAIGYNLEQPWFVKTDPGENRQNVTLRYGARFIAMDGLPKLIPNNDCDHPNEVADAKWVKVDELQNYEFAFNHDKVILQYFEHVAKLQAEFADRVSPNV